VLKIHLCKEAEDFRDKLRSAGVKFTHKRFEEPDAFTYWNSPAAREAWQMMIDHMNFYLPRR